MANITCCPHCGKDFDSETQGNQKGLDNKQKEQELAQKLISLGFQGKLNSDDTKKISNRKTYLFLIQNDLRE